MQDCKDLDILVVTTTVGSVADAKLLAREIVQRRLAACVQLEEGLVSVYRWQGAVHEDPEVRLTIKTVAGRAEALHAFFKEKHPYEVPQFVAWSGEASAAYAAWARGEVAAG